MYTHNAFVFIHIRARDSVNTGVGAYGRVYGHTCHHPYTHPHIRIGHWPIDCMAQAIEWPLIIKYQQARPRYGCLIPRNLPLRQAYQPARNWPQTGLGGVIGPLPTLNTLCSHKRLTIDWPLNCSNAPRAYHTHTRTLSPFLRPK